MQYDVSLKSYNTLGFEARAQALAEADSLLSLRRILVTGRRQFDRIIPLGGGSNVVMKPRIDGLVVRYMGQRIWQVPVNVHEALWHVEAGVNWHALVEKTTAAGWWGIENLALIPGSTGAAPIQNIGAYGVEMADVIDSVHVMHLADGRYEILDRAQCDFGYRHSIFKTAMAGQVIVVRVVLRLGLEVKPRVGYGDLARRLPENPGPSDVATAVAAIRQEKLPDPRLLGNAGSFFKNPVVSSDQATSLIARWPDMPFWQTGQGIKLAAGWLIDQCGWKGYCHKSVGVHQQQALVLVHHGEGSVHDLLDMAGRIQHSVEARFGVTLEMEPGVIGA
ncbi:UDP-N-acetylenolpyruvoylglucosamine reductase [Kushneria pakistanensis]|uniref:UDP-N-acetylenolpyruvoylglucosamine reductase n=1 Tax=Kushneria pakistanensis TaxID=1508770 RepID=A0ABQ3FDY4_9GAMM|nr:UDP-N-acetylmuramate dehydrogenase [Kushneria pakistanensis]GHC19186.1 UDP-N-acetylenolpyruvoylglucosamine reductase [Kushneria pakistanensis]